MKQTTKITPKFTKQGKLDKRKPKAKAVDPYSKPHAQYGRSPVASIMDELTTAAPEVQQAMHAMVNERKIGEHRLRTRSVSAPYCAEYYMSEEQMETLLRLVLNAASGITVGLLPDLAGVVAVIRDQLL